jgi:hypothetical protein
LQFHPAVPSPKKNNHRKKSGTLIIMAKVKNFTLSKPQIKELLQDIEATGEPRERVEPTRILKLKPHIYGDFKSAQRKAFLAKYYQLRRNSLANYSK